MIAAAVIITLLYVLSMLFLLYGFFQVPVFFGKNSAPKITFSIVIPYRNEAENLPLLFNSLLKLQYPPEMFEIIGINDASEDNSTALWKEFRKQNPHLNIKLMQNVRRSGSPKKDAIKTAISASNMEYIITTDADCEVPENWLHEFNSKIEKTAATAIAAPVALKTKDLKMTFLKHFQEMDIFSLQTATVGGFGVNIPFLCNGANFCYSKEAFLKVNGFEGNNEVASGDDIFLLEKFRKEGFNITFLKSPSAVVFTAVSPSWKRVFFQRVRWAAKTSAYKNAFSKILGLLVFTMNLMVVILIILTLTGQLPFSILIFSFLLKFNVDFLIIYQSASFFGRERVMRNYFLSSLLYPFFSSGVVIYSLFSGYEWKGRRFKR